MEIIKRTRIFQISCVANLAFFVYGTCLAWASPMIPKLRNHTADSPLSYGISEVEEGWISSLLAVGGFCSCPLAGPLYNRIGRKPTLLSSAFFFAAAYIMLLVGNNIWFIYVARFLQGISAGLIGATSPIYMAETTTDNLRGPLGCLMVIFMTIGILFVYCIGPYVNYLTLQWCCLPVPVIFFVAFLFMPESPYFFALKSRTQQGIKSLQFLHGQSAEMAEEEMLKIQKAVNQELSNEGTFRDVFKFRGYRRAFVISAGLQLFQQLSGTAAVTFNSQSIFTSAQSTLDPGIATIILGLVQLVSNLITPLIIDRAGRKLILMISSLGTCLALIVLGTFFYVQEFGDVSSFLWVPIPSLIIFYAAFSLGLGPIPNVVMGEILPSNIKGKVSSCSIFIHWIATFIVTRWYPELNALGTYIAFWLFSGFCALSFLFVLFAVVETKGLSLQKIQEKLHAS